MMKDERKKQLINEKRATDNQSEYAADQDNRVDLEIVSRGDSSSAASALGSGTTTAASSGSTRTTHRKRKDGRLHVPKGSLTEEVLIAERDRVLEKLKTKRKEDWTKQEIAEERRTASRLSEFQSRSRWKKIVDDLKKTSEEQKRHSSLQQQQMAELKAELLSVHGENAVLRQHLTEQQSFGRTMRGTESGQMPGPPSILQPFSGSPPAGFGMEHLLRIQAAESAPQQQLTGTQQQASLQQAPIETNLLVQLLQYIQGTPQQVQQQDNQLPRGTDETSIPRVKDHKHG